MENSTEKEFFEIREMMRIIESPEFQKFLAKPLKDYRYAQKNNFFSDSVKEQWRKGGRVEAVNEFFKILKGIDTEYRNKQYDLDNLEGK